MNATTTITFNLTETFRGTCLQAIRAKGKNQLIFAGESRDSCGVCYERIHLASTIVLCPRGHIFHDRCILQWQGGLTCPQDRGSMGEQISAVYVLGQRLIFPQNAEEIGPWMLEHLSVCEQLLLSTHIRNFIETLPPEDAQAIERIVVPGYILILQEMIHHYANGQTENNASQIIEHIEELLQPYRASIVERFADAPITPILQEYFDQIDWLRLNIERTDLTQSSRILRTLQFVLSLARPIASSQLRQDLERVGNERFVQRHITEIARMPDEQQRIQYVEQMRETPSEYRSNSGYLLGDNRTRLSYLLQQQPRPFTANQALALQTLNRQSRSFANLTETLYPSLENPITTTVLFTILSYVLILLMEGISSE